MILWFIEALLSAGGLGLTYWLFTFEDWRTASAVPWAPPVEVQSEGAFSIIPNHDSIGLS